MIMKNDDLNKKELINLQDTQNLDNLLNKIKIFKQDIAKEMLSYNITNKVIKKIFEGEEIFNCENCNTPNVYNSYQDKTHKVHIYKCDNCNTIF